jgi:hypothetical protein
MTDAHIATIPKNSREEVRIYLGEFKGALSLDIRTYAATSGGKPVATPKGVSLKVDRLPQLVDALTAAQQALLAIPSV